MTLVTVDVAAVALQECGSTETATQLRTADAWQFLSGAEACCSEAISTRGVVPRTTFASHTMCWMCVKMCNTRVWTLGYRCVSNGVNHYSDIT